MLQVDIFSFSMVIYEILSGRRPFEEYRNLAQIYKAIRTESKRPCMQVCTFHLCCLLVQHINFITPQF
jgi:serine/threonine protein kinase